MTAPKDYILVGAIGGAIGLKGEVRLASFTADLTAIAGYGPLKTEDGREFEVLALRPNAKGLAARLSGVVTREAAEALKGLTLYVPRANLPCTEENDFYFTDLIGLAAMRPSGERLGEITGVENYGAGDLLVVRLDDGARVEFIPFTDSFVPHIDITARRAIIDIPADMFESLEPEGDANKARK